FEDNAAAIINEDFRFGSITVSSGVLTVNSPNLYLGFSGGLSGKLTLLNGVVFNPHSVQIARSEVLPMESFLLDSLATLNVSDNNLVLAATNLELNGSVIVAESAFDPLSLPTNGGIAGAAAVDTFYNLYLGGSTTKRLTGNL